MLFIKSLDPARTVGYQRAEGLALTRMYCIVPINAHPKKATAGGVTVSGDGSPLQQTGSPCMKALQVPAGLGLILAGRSRSSYCLFVTSQSTPAGQTSLSKDLRRRVSIGSARFTAQCARTRLSLSIPLLGQVT